jgi:F-type H+-transporting ATPase subunit b
MNLENRSGWRWGVVVLGGLVVCLLLVGLALAEEAAPGAHEGISPAKITDFTWRTVNFLVFAGLLIYLLTKKFPIKNFFMARSQEIAKSLEDLERQKAAAAAALKEAEARLAEVAKEREAILKQYMAEGEMEKGKILDKANTMAARIKEMAALSIQQETRKATQGLREEVADLATQMAADLIKEKATLADQQGLVKEYLKKVVETH